MTVFINIKMFTFGKKKKKRGLNINALYWLRTSYCKERLEKSYILKQVCYK